MAQFQFHQHITLARKYLKPKPISLVNQQMYIADSFVPWVCTWLSTYEYWLVTGKWHYDEMFTGRNQIKEWKKEK